MGLLLALTSGNPSEQPLEISGYPSTVIQIATITTDSLSQYKLFLKAIEQINIIQAKKISSTKKSLCFRQF